MPRWSALLVVGVVSSCVYFNEMYDTQNYYDRAVDRRRAGDQSAALAAFDSVIAKAARLVRSHPESSYAARAALLKARSEIAREYWTEAAATAEYVSRLTSDPASLAVANGLRGIAMRRLGDPADAERLLTLGLEENPSAEDRVLFLFHRGLARLDLNDAPGAADDLRSISAEQRLSDEVRLELARGLLDAGQFAPAVELTGELLRENRFANFGAGMDAHLDSLARRAPAEFDGVLTSQLAETEITTTKRILLEYYHGLVSEALGDVDEALRAYGSAAAAGGGSRYVPEAAYRAASLRIRTADDPSDIADTRSTLDAARAVSEPQLAVEVARVRREVTEFASLVEAYTTRGGSAAEAALRAAEIAGGELASPAVARGLYLRYLELAPGSPWRAKAIAGALSYASTPARGDWVDDAGDSTTRLLQAQLDGLPPTDPYRVSLSDLPRSSDSDSLYVERERDLYRTLVEIRMLYDTTASLVVPSDTAPLPTPDAPPAEEVIE